MENPSSPDVSCSSDSPGASPAANRFHWPVRIYYEDTDTAGVVYYANYLRFFERCRSEWMRSLGFGQRELVERDSVVFVVAGTQMRYRRAARLDDAIVIEASIRERYGSYVIFEQRALRDGELLCEGSVKVACVDAASMRPKRIPAAMQRALAPLCPEDAAPARPLAR